MPLTIQQWDEIARETNSKKMKLTFSDGTIIQNDKIVAEQMSLEESLCSEENLRYGCCESSCFQIRIAYTNKSFVGLTVDVEMEYPPQWFTLVNDIGETIVDQDNVPITTFDEAEAEEGYKAVFGTFRVISDKPTNDRKYRDLICYDLMYDILHANVIDWFENVTFPISLKNLRDSFFTSLGIEQVSTTLINDNFMVQGAIEASYELSGRSIIESICEFNATFGHMRSDGKFEYISLPTGNSVTYPYYVDGSGAYADYVTETITGLTAVNAQGDSGTFVGTSEDNLYIMQSNLMTFGAEGTQDLQTALTNVLTQISAFTYRPFDVTVYGNPMLPLGTAIVLNTKYQTINSFVMNKYMSGIQALRDHLSAVGEQTYPSDVNRISNEIVRTGGKVHKLINDVNQLSSEIYDEHGNSLIQQTLDEIVLKVDSNGKLVQAKLSQNASQGSTFTIVADTFILNSNNFKVTANGQITATSGTIGGLTITNTSIYGEESGVIPDGQVNEKLEIISSSLKTTLKTDIVHDATTHTVENHSESSIGYNPEKIWFRYKFDNYDNYDGVKYNEYSGDHYYEWTIDSRGVLLQAWDIQHYHAGGQEKWGHSNDVVGFNNSLNTSLETIYTRLYNSCDKRLKHNIKPIDDKIINAIGRCETYQFNLINRDEQGLYLGIMAQDLVSECEKEKIDAEDYRILQKGYYVPNDDTEYYLIDYPQLALLQIQYLKKQIDELKEIIDKK